jgi:hypothetical protein
MLSLSWKVNMRYLTLIALLTVGCGERAAMLTLPTAPSAVTGESGSFRVLKLEENSCPTEPITNLHVGKVGMRADITFDGPSGWVYEATITRRDTGETWVAQNRDGKTVIEWSSPMDGVFTAVVYRKPCSTKQGQPVTTEEFSFDSAPEPPVDVPPVVVPPVIVPEVPFTGVSHCNESFVFSGSASDEFTLVFPAGRVLYVTTKDRNHSSTYQVGQSERVWVYVDGVLVGRTADIPDHLKEMTTLFYLPNGGSVVKLVSDGVGSIHGYCTSAK